MALFAIRRGDFVVVVFVESEQQPKREVTRLRLASVVPRVRVLAASRARIQRRGNVWFFCVVGRRGCRPKTSRCGGVHFGGLTFVLNKSQRRRITNECLISESNVFNVCVVVLTPLENLVELLEASHLNDGAVGGEISWGKEPAFHRRKDDESSRAPRRGLGFFRRDSLGGVPWFVERTIDGEETLRISRLGLTKVYLFLRSC